MPTDDFRRAALPLFAEGVVDALEWSVDVRYPGGIPSWYAGLLDHYASVGRLYAHGVHYSTLTATWLPHHERWLGIAADATRTRAYKGFSEHFGFMVGGDFDRGAPLPLPFVPQVVALGVDRMRRLADAVGVPVGLENMALALSGRDVEQHGDFLEALLDPVDGFLLLDLHNLWCQAHNFGFDPVALLERYPLQRVRELHLSGGSWTSLADGSAFRRDTHDGAVPDEVFALLEAALPRLPALELVVLERMGGTIGGVAEEAGLRNDFARIREVVGG